MSSSNPVFCVLTPRGRAAVAAICVKGPTAIDIVQRHFTGAAGIPILSCPGDAVVYGNWLPEGRKGEDLVVCSIAHDEIEIYCHGGDAAANVIRHSLLSSGVREIPISEYAHHRANGPMEGELTLALTHAPTRKTARLLLAQQLPQHKLIASLRKCVAARDNERAVDMIDKSLDWKRYGRHLVEPWSVVVCGQPNVGKSSLINALVGFERAIVHPIAGTTRDILSQTTAVDGWPIELTDTAGLHDGDNDIERAGIRLALQRIPVADLVIAVFDASRTCTDDDFLFIDRINPGIVVVNKSDLKNEEFTQFPGMPVSAKTGQGIQELIHRMAETLVPQLPPSSQAVPVSSQQLGFLEQAKSLIQGNRWADADRFLGHNTPFGMCSL